MKFRIGLLLLMLNLFAAPANELWACGNDDEKKMEQKSCCADSSQNDAAHCSQNADACNQTHPGESCPPDNDGCGGCHCPGCGTASHTGSAFALEAQDALIHFMLNASVRKLAFYFAYHLPEAVYLPIWQPPKIGA